MRPLAVAVMLLGSAAPAEAEPEHRAEIAVSMNASSVAPWDRSFRAALKAVAAAPPEGLTVAWADRAARGRSAAERIAALADAAPIIWRHSHLSDAGRAALAAHPETLFVVAGAGNAPIGGNQLWVEKRLHEPAWLLGALAARASRTGRIGLITTADLEDVNEAANAYRAGARAARADIEIAHARLDAWVAPQRAAAALADQAADGADIVFQMEGSLEGCVAADLLCLTAFTDESAAAPDLALGAATADWRPDLAAALAAWRRRSARGGPYRLEGGPRVFGLAEDGARFEVNAALLRRRLGPAEAEALLRDLSAWEAEIRAGARVIGRDPSPPPPRDLIRR